jgi:hypothetical protein
MIATDMMGSRQGMENEHCIGTVLIKGSPSCVSKLGRRNASAVTKGEIPKRNERAFGVGHAETKTEMMDFKTLNPKMKQDSVVKSASLGLLGCK